MKIVTAKPYCTWGRKLFIVVLSVLSDLSDIPCESSEQIVGEFLNFVIIGPRKAMFFYRRNLNYIYACTVKLYNV